MLCMGGPQLQASAACAEKTLEGREGWEGRSALIARQGRLGSAGPRRQVYLGEICIQSRLEDGLGYIDHLANISILI